MGRKEKAQNDDLIEKEYQKFVKRRLHGGTVLIVFGIFFMLMFLAGLDNVYDMGTAWIALIGGLLSTVAGLLLRRDTKRKSYQLAPYKPTKGFKFYRKTAQERVRLYTMLQKLWTAIFVVFIVIFIVNIGENGRNIISLLQMIALWLSIICGLSFFKQRIRFHQDIDDATYFELEELGLISEQDVVTTLYKDFPSWDNARTNSKILVLTLDTLIILNFKAKNSASKAEFPLSQVERLGFFRAGNEHGDTLSKGYALTIGLCDRVVRIFLSGSSYQDSPEEFLSYFLKTLDDKFLKKPKAARRTKTNPSQVIMKNMDKIRQIEIEDETVQRKNDVLTSPSQKRVIDL